MAGLLRPTESWPAPAHGGSFLFDRGPSYTQGPRYHQGLDVPYPVGTPLYASGDGEVTAVGDTGTSWGYGRYVKVQYGIFAVLLGHNSQVNVRVGQNVTSATQLASSGGRKGAPGAGSSSGPHSHIELTQSGAIIDPDNLSPRGGLAGGNPTPLPVWKDDTMFRLVADASSATVWVVGASGKRVGLASPYHLTLMMRLFKSTDAADKMLAAELDICATYLKLVDATDTLTVPAPDVDEQAIIDGILAGLPDVPVPSVDPTAIAAAVDTALADDFAGVNANINDQPTHFEIAPKE
jgi:Peptidase family M23